VYIDDTPIQFRVIGYARTSAYSTADTVPLSSPTSLEYRRGVLYAANVGSYTTGSKPRNVMCMSGFRRP
jgi:hypothetical protein